MDINRFRRHSENELIYLLMKISTLYLHIIKYYIIGRWWISSRKMLEFDVNDDEWDSVTGMPVQPSGQLKQMW